MRNGLLHQHMTSSQSLHPALAAPDRATKRKSASPLAPGAVEGEAAFERNETELAELLDAALVSDDETARFGALRGLRIALLLDAGLMLGALLAYETWMIAVR